MDTVGGAQAEAWARRWAGLDAPDIIAAALGEAFPGRIAVSSSFGTEAAVLLDLVAQVDRSVPVVFLETGMLFDETLAYRDQLIDRLGLRDVRSVGPDPKDLARLADDVHLSDPDACCHARKVAPLERALSGFDAWISGRKRFHGGARSRLAVVEWSGSHTKVNPLAGWDKARIEDHFHRRALPRHPLEALGYASVGCVACTRAVAPGENIRAGRWAGQAKTECGIHRAPWYGKDVAGAAT